MAPPLVSSQSLLPSHYGNHHHPYSREPSEENPNHSLSHTCDEYHYDSRLCRFCRSWLSQRSSDSLEIPIFNAHPEGFRANVSSFLSQGRCKGCEFLRRSVRNKLEMDRYTLADVKMAFLHGPYPFSWLKSRVNPDYQVNDESSPPMHIYESHTVKNVTYNRLCAAMEILVTLSGDRDVVFMVQFEALLLDAKHLHSIDYWVKPRFDTSIISKWLDICAGQKHIESTYYSDDFTHNFRLMDLHDMCIVSGIPEQDLNYAALSYMWPESTYPCPERLFNKLLLSNEKKLEQKGSLTKIGIPVIKDSIALCQSLNFRYLWVDRFCIIQDDPSDLAEQIGSMNKIYASAHFTLICALNFRNPRGLPGFTQNRTNRNVMGPYSNLFLGDVNDASKIDNSVQNTRWGSRGWTFQEFRLSQRRIFITDRQLLFDCSCGYAQEMYTWAKTAEGEDDNLGMYLYSKENPTAALKRAMSENLTYCRAINASPLLRRCMNHLSHTTITRHPSTKSLPANYASYGDLASPAMCRRESFAESHSDVSLLADSSSDESWPPTSEDGPPSDTPALKTKTRPSTLELVRDRGPPSESDARILRRFFQHRDLTFYDYAEAVQSYSSRRLTLTSDNLAAFAGILARFRASSPTPQGIYYGFFERFFIRSLFWRCATGQHVFHIRKDSAKSPSWSWARRLNAIEFLCTESSGIVIDKLFARVFYMHPTAGPYLLNTLFKEEVEEETKALTHPPQFELPLEPSVLSEAKRHPNSLVFDANVAIVSIKVQRDVLSEPLKIYEVPDDPHEGDLSANNKVARQIGNVRYDSMEDLDSISCSPVWCDLHDDHKECSLADVALIFCQDMTPHNPLSTKMDLVMVVKGQTVTTPSKKTLLVCSRLGFAEVKCVELPTIRKKMMSVILK